MMGIKLIEQERKRQIEEEGFSSDHDDATHLKGELARAGYTYEVSTLDAMKITSRGLLVPVTWPWHRDRWKPRSRRKNLIRAGALYQAEIERLQRRVQLIGRQIDQMPD